MLSNHESNPEHVSSCMKDRLLLYCNDKTKMCLWSYQGYTLTNTSDFDFTVMARTQEACRYMDQDRLEDLVEGIKMLIKYDGKKLC